MRKLSNVKTVLSGSLVELWEHDFSIPYGKKDNDEKRIGKREKIVVVDEESKARKEESRKKSVHKARNELTRLIHANAWHWKKPDGTLYLPVFMTLTFKEDIRDLKQANHAFSNFVKRLNFRIGNSSKTNFLKYVAVPEYQDLTRGGVVHYHVIFFNLEFIWKSELEEVWDQGFAKIKKIDTLDKAVNYVCKYITKKFDDRRADGQKRYFPSRDLLRPITIREKSFLGFIKDIPKEYITKVQEYVSYFMGSVKYTRYLLPKGDTIGKYLNPPQEI
jgi:hypothetical protein